MSHSLNLQIKIVFVKYNYYYMFGVGYDLFHDLGPVLLALKAVFKD